MTTKISQKNLMKVGDYRIKIITFALPIFIGHLFQQFSNTADSIIVGNLIGPNALAAVSSTGSLVYLLVGFFMGFSSGAGILVSRYIGARNEKRITEAVHTSIAVAIFFSVVMTIIGVGLSPTFLTWLGTPQEVFHDASLYLRIYFAGISALIFYNTFVSILQASGDSKHPLYYLVISSITNILLDILFISYFHMGVEGAALATVLSEILSALLALWRLTHTTEAIRIEFKKIHIHKMHLDTIIRYGLPTALQASVIDLGNLLVQSHINSFGNLAMAGVGAYQKIEGFSFLPVTSFSIALSTYVSQNIGAKRMDRVRKGISFGITSALIAVEIIGLTYFFFAPNLIQAFNSDPSVISFGVSRARICSLFYFLLAYSHVSSAVMRGLGKPSVPMFVMLFCWCFIRVSVLLTLGKIYHFIELAFWLYPITWALSSITYFIYMKKLKKNDVF
ncbi:MAG: MATE family efflux transporter [Solobacterium sp.]|nr:MATE family efflux transporter [Solobacterium sp.]